MWFQTLSQPPSVSLGHLTRSLINLTIFVADFQQRLCGTSFLTFYCVGHFPLATQASGHRTDVWGPRSPCHRIGRFGANQ